MIDLPYTEAVIILILLILEPPDEVMILGREQSRPSPLVPVKLAGELENDLSLLAQSTTDWTGGRGTTYPFIVAFVLVDTVVVTPALLSQAPCSRTAVSIEQDAQVCRTLVLPA